MSLEDSVVFVDYYELLGIPHTAEVHQIRKAYILKAKEHHPDAGGSIDMMQQLNTAYRTLKNTTSKAAYDMLHSFHIGATTPSEYRYDDGRKVTDVNDMNDEEIDAFLNSLMSEYRNGPQKSSSGVRQWIKNILNKV